MARLLILGGSGFIGSNLVSKLLFQGHSVTNFDRPESSNIKFFGLILMTFLSMCQLTCFQSIRLSQKLIGSQPLILAMELKCFGVK